MPDDWPKPPIWPEDVPTVRALLTDAEWQALLRRLVSLLPDGKLVDPSTVFDPPSAN